MDDHAHATRHSHEWPLIVIAILALLLVLASAGEHDSGPAAPTSSAR